jgi:TetR/AcrR family transcriptional repressor of nem operon
MARPREFDLDVVVDKAMEVFWRQGYAAASVQDLVETTGVNRASLYSVFGDKRSLYLRSLARYRDQVVPGRMAILERPDASLPEIREYFEGVVTDLVDDMERKGCLMVNCAVELASNDPEIAASIASHFHRLEYALHAALERACELGELSCAERTQSYARLLVASAQGLIVIGKSQPRRELLLDVVHTTLGSLN